ncbi:P-loop NTPase family protein [Solidesulfovibrio sp.]
MSNGTGQKPTEKLLGLIRSTGNGKGQRLFRIVPNGDMCPAPAEAGKTNVGFCSVAPFERSLSRIKPQLDAIWSNLQLTQGRSPHSVLLTSASKGEGVTYVSERLSIYLAQTYGHKVLYVNIAGSMSDTGAPGSLPPEEILDRLASSEGIDSLTMGSNVPGLWVLNLDISKSQHALPWLLPQRNVMEVLLDHARSAFDLVLFDAESVLAAPWTATIAKPVDVNLLVCRFAVTRREVLNALLDAFKAAGVRPQGIILNARRYSVPQSLYKLLK